METPSLWRDFIWPHFDFREERSIKQLLLLSNFPSFIHCNTGNIENVIVCDTLRYAGDGHSLEMANCNLEQVCIMSDTLTLSDSFLIRLSAHGGLVHVILNVNCFFTQRLQLL